MTQPTASAPMLSLTDAPVLVTGAAGFIGFHVASRLLQQGCCVVGLDNMNPYYDVRLKEARLALLTAHARFSFHRGDVADDRVVADLFRTHRFGVVVHLAAQAGVRHSLTHPHVYVHSNVQGFLHILEGCRAHAVRHLVFASSSSVYGANTKLPFSVHDPVDHPVSLYAATKKANELMAHSYAHLYGIPSTGLRFFTVYGPWGRPDMALFLFTEAILAGEPIDVFNEGRMVRDFTYIDDIVEGVVRICALPPIPTPAWNSHTPDPATSAAPYRLFNIGNHHPVGLGECIDWLEEALGKTAQRRMRPMQPGDVPATHADVEDLARVVGFRPRTGLRDGIHRFVAWYREYYGAAGC